MVMKKSLLTLALSVASFLTLSAQQTANQTSQEVKCANGYSKAFDVSADWDKSNEILELGAGINLWQYGYAELDASYCFGDFKNTTGKVGLGLQKRIVNGPLLLQAKVFPYVGVVDNEFDTECIYGANAKFEAGISLLKINDKSIYFTVGYKLDAIEFDTKRMFDNGDWCFGLTFVW